MSEYVVGGHAIMQFEEGTTKKEKKKEEEEEEKRSVDGGKEQGKVDSSLLYSVLYCTCTVLYLYCTVLVLYCT